MMMVGPDGQPVVPQGGQPMMMMQPMQNMQNMQNGGQPMMMMMPAQMQNGGQPMMMMMPTQMQNGGQQQMMMQMPMMQGGVQMQGGSQMQGMMPGGVQAVQPVVWAQSNNGMSSNQASQVGGPPGAFSGPPGTLTSSLQPSPELKPAAAPEEAESPQGDKSSKENATSPTNSVLSKNSVVESRRELLQKHASEVVARLRRSGARRNDLAAAQLRHSTFSALNLEVSGGSRKNTTLQPLSRQTIAELQSEWAASRKKAAEAAKAKQIDSNASTASTEETTDEIEEAAPSPRGDGGFSRRYLLVARHAFSGSTPPTELANFVSDEHVSAWKSEKKGRAPDSPTSWRSPLTPSDKAYKIASASSGEVSRTQQLTRDVNSLLNKVCPENVATIIERVASTEVRSVDELQLIIGLIFKKSLAEPHYCETYADMVSALKQRMPEFKSSTGGKPITFKAAVLNATQSEFEALSDILTLSEEETRGLEAGEIDYLKKKRKDRARANMKFIGQLFLRALLGTRIIESVIRDLAKCSTEAAVPEEPMVECLCELLQNIGYTLEVSGSGGQAALTEVCFRLQNLKKNYSKRIQFAIQDVLDIRSAGWKKKSFKASAKTKEEIRREQEMELRAQACGHEVVAAEVQIAGARRPAMGW